jgi:hypothetical protein
MGSMKNRGSVRWSVVFGILSFLLLLLAGFAYAVSHLNEKANISKSISNGRQIVMALRMYASDHDGKYPDAALTTPRSSNDVFRKLFTEGVLDSEMIFECPFSPYHPDGNIGSPPDFLKAVEAGENHWAMTAGLSESAPGGIPLVYENPITASWPPSWNPSSRGTSTPGRIWTWSGGIIVGLNDGSVQVRKLESRWGKSAGLEKDWNGKDLFEAALDPVKFPKGVVLDVLRKGE